MLDLRGKRALVTGAGTRVGAAIATALGAQGMQVAVHYHGSSAGAEQTCRDIEAQGGSAFSVRADLYDETAVRALARDVIARMGGLDVLVPSAANFDAVALEDITDHHWQRALSLNLLAPFALAQECSDALVAARGAIVFITCISRVVPFTGYLPYEVSKAGVHQMMRVLALSLAPHVRVNAVAPGTVLPPTDMPSAALAELVARIPLARTGGADAVAQAVVQLARSSFITGSEITVDGGRSLSVG